MRMPTREAQTLYDELEKEVVAGALLGDSTLRDFLEENKDDVLDLVLAHIMSHPEGDFMEMIKPRLGKFCVKRAEQIMRNFIREDSAPMRRARK